MTSGQADRESIPAWMDSYNLVAQSDAPSNK